METTTIIRIEKPTKELVAFIEKAQLEKKERIHQMREKFVQSQLPKC